MKFSHFCSQFQSTRNSSEPVVVGGLSVPNVTASVMDNETDFVTLVVVTKEERPYVMLNKGRTGNEAYDGFSIDLLKVRNIPIFEIAAIKCDQIVE